LMRNRIKWKEWTENYIPYYLVEYLGEDKVIALWEALNTTKSYWRYEGFGKTIVLSSILGKIIEANNSTKACVLAHRDELTYQNQDKFLKINPEINTSLVNANTKDWDGQVNFAMVQTLSREKTLNSMPKLDILVIDEAHHSTAKTYRTIINKAKELNPNLKLLGVTATPARGDKNGLGRVFSNCAMQVKLGDVIGDGHLVMPRTFIIDVGIQDKLKELHKRTKGEYDEEEVEAIMNVEPVNEAVVEHWKEKA
ncbi:putative ATP-dependent helicase IRC3, partial [Stylophora pistillata]|uniref:putative ATP-dependent helicase IRC3 n=1 Tax=Stylophora pistillata TaxID=50429 RepID=UPI000C03B96E